MDYDETEILKRGWWYIINIAIIDADLIGRKKHRFPNLACMKLSGYYKDKGHNVRLKANYNDLKDFDKVYISKVFTDTEIDPQILTLPNVEYGGTGFFYDKAPPLPYEIEHHMPDYDLYGEWVNQQIQKGRKYKEFEYYTDYSIGFTTRKCFRGCHFCVNKNYKKVEPHSPLKEFHDPNRKNICLLDDNVLGHGGWQQIVESLIETKKPFQFKQGLDIRLINNKRAKILSNVKYNGDYIFAFDHIEDKEIITQKLKVWRNHCTKTTKLYVFCGYFEEHSEDIQDIVNTFERIKILIMHGCLPYIMRHNTYKNNKYRGIYSTIARWCNQPNFYKKMSFSQFCKYNESYNDCTTRYYNQFINDHPEIAMQYFDLRFEDLNLYKK